jgi:hypothetical protein
VSETPTLLDWMEFIARHRGDRFAIVSYDDDTALRNVVDPLRHACPDVEFKVIRVNGVMRVDVLENHIRVITAKTASRSDRLLRGYSCRGVWLDPIDAVGDPSGRFATDLGYCLLGENNCVFNAALLPGLDIDRFRWTPVSLT